MKSRVINAIVAFASIILAASPAHARARGGACQLEIVSARFGAANFVDVRMALGRCMGASQCTIDATVGALRIADPDPGKPKVLRLTVKDGADVGTVEIPENNRASIACDAAGPTGPMGAAGKTPMSIEIGKIPN